MNSEFWINKWQNAETRFHQSDYHTFLTKFAGKLSIGTVLVPLCGKSLDMLYLASLGHSVIGVELSPIACKDFFTEANIEYSIISVENFTIFKSTKISLWCGDFFKLPQEAWSRVTAVYDRAALIALPEDIRKNYASAFFNKRLGPLEILLITLEYQKDLLKGPPYSVAEEELNNIYDTFSIQKLYSEREEKFSTVEVIENIYFLQRK